MSRDFEFLSIVKIVFCDCGLRLSSILIIVTVIIDTWLFVLKESLSCFFYSKLLEDATSENEKLTEILQVKDETERKQAGTYMKL